MKPKIMKNIKCILVFIIISVIALLMTISLTDEKTLDEIQKVLSTPLRAEEDGGWTTFRTVEEPDTLYNLLNNADQEHVGLVGDDYIYVGYEHLVDFTSLFCCQLGVELPKQKSMSITSGGHTTDKTDQNEYIRLLRLDLVNAGQEHTIFKSNDIWTGWFYVGGSIPNVFGDLIETEDGKKYYNGQTLVNSMAYYKKGDMVVRDANPKEAWILVEYANNIQPDTDFTYDNDPNNPDGYVITAEDIINNGYNLLEIRTNGFIVYEINGVRYQKYGDSYYRIKETSKGDENHGDFAYVQYAWWTTKTGEGENISSYAIRDTDLALEAEDFQTYVETVTGRTYERGEDGKITPNPYDEKGLFKIEYLNRVSMKPRYAKDADVLWDPYLNQYIIGPFSVSYDRFVTQRGDRDKVSFSGISDVVVVGEDPQGNPIELVRGRDFEITYEDDSEHDKARNKFDTEEDYPYPAPDEEFYITLNYSAGDGERALVGLQSIEFSFDYLTTGGSYEFYKGHYLSMQWVQKVDEENGQCRWIKVKVGEQDIPEDDERTEIIRTPAGENCFAKDEAILPTEEYVIADLGEGEIVANLDNRDATVSARVVPPGGTGPGGTPPDIPTFPPYTPTPTPSPNPTPGPGPGPKPLAPGYKRVPVYDYRHQHNYPAWLELANYIEQDAQDLGKAIGLKDVLKHKVKKTFDGDSIDLTITIAGQVWIDNDEQKDQSLGKIGLYDGQDKPAGKDTVEIIVWQQVEDAETGRIERREKVVCWDKEGNEIDFKKNRLFVDEKGRYEIPRIQFPSMKDKQNRQRVYYDIEFVYDGQTYETTDYMVEANGDTIESRTSDYLKRYNTTTEFYDNSLVAESAEERKRFDASFSEIVGDGAVQNNKTTGKANVASGSEDIYYVDVDDTRKGKSSALEYESKLYGEGEFSKLRTNLITNEGKYNEEEGRFEGKVKDKYRFSTTLRNSGWWIYFERTYIRRDNDDNKLRDNSKDDETKEYKGEKYNPLTSWIENINLGLIERYHADVSAAKDLYSSKVVVNNQESPVATYNSLVPLTDEALNIQIDPNYRKTEYKIDLYNSDFNYRSSVYNTTSDTITRDVLKVIKDKTELRLFVTYKITLRNESVTLNAAINEFKDYYDKTFTPILKDERARIELTDVESDANNKAQFENRIVAYAPYYRKLKADGSNEDLYNWNKDEDLKASRISNGVTGDLTFSTFNVSNKDYQGSLSGSLRAVQDGNVSNEKLLLAPGESFEIFVTYEVDTEGFEKIQQAKQANEMNYTAGEERASLVGQKNNIVEITNYSTVYSEATQNRHKGTRYKAGNVSGRVDQDSAPDNIDLNAIKDLDKAEDDTEYAPVLKVDVKKPEDRTLNGVVWEDKKETNSSNGNGKYDSGESGIPNVDVTLVEKIRVTDEDLKGEAGTVSDLNMLDYEFEFIWPEAVTGLKSKVKSDANGAYSFQNFVAGDYVVRFEYGNSTETLKYNGQDYKNTAYQIDKKNATANNSSDTGTYDMRDLPGKSTLNNKWHDLSANDSAKDLEKDRVSDARDYEPRRMKVIAYSRTISNQNAEVLAAHIANDANLTNEYKSILEANKADLIEHTAMVANTAKLKIDVEKQDNITYKKTDKIQKTVSGTADHKYEVANIDFGLVERPETKLYIRKEISKIELMKNDGKDIILSIECDEDGNIIKASGKTLDGNVNVNKMTEIRKENLGLDAQGFKYVAMEATMLNGLDINITYNISVINDSETDYVGRRLADLKSIQDVYDEVVKYETEAENDFSSATWGLVPFNTGNGIVYGKYLGLNYYTNKVSNGNEKETYGYDYLADVEVTTTVDKVIDYIDNDISLNKQLTQNRENMSWNESTSDDRKYLLSRVSFQDNDSSKPDAKLLDNKNRSYIGTSSKNNIAVSSNETITMQNITYPKTEISTDGTPVMKKEGNILVPSTHTETISNVYTAEAGTQPTAKSAYNPSLTTQLKPGESASIGIVTATHTNEETTDNMNYDNLVEIAVYSNTVGRRDKEAIPGNANMIAKQEAMYKAGYVMNYSTKEFSARKVTIADGSSSKEITTERDAYAPRDTVTFTEPTGLSLAEINKQNNMVLVLSSLVSLAIVVSSAVIIIEIRKRIK